MSTLDILYIILGITAFILFVVLVPAINKLIQVSLKKTHFNKSGHSSQIRLVHSLTSAVHDLSSTKTGAIITIENKIKLDDHRTDGVKIDANISSDILLTIFSKNTPLHDGAVVISNNKIKYASTFYKITPKSVKNKYGARHRAALGISEETDSLTIIVSEETGKISFAQNGVIKEVSKSSFQEKLSDHLKEV